MSDVDEDPKLDEADEAELELPDSPGDEEELIISFDGEDPAEPNEEENSEGWKKLRAENRALKQAQADKDAKLAAFETPAIVLGPKPTLEDCDYDGDKFEVALDTWKDKERAAKETQTAEQKQAETFRTEFNRDLATTKEQESALKAPGYEEAKAEVISSLDMNQQAVLIQAAKNRANVIYALGKHPARLATLAAIKNPLKLAVAINDLERGLTMTSRRQSPEPEGILRGSARLSPMGPDKELARLEAAADKSGDRTAVVQYKRKLNEKQTARAR